MAGPAEAETDRALRGFLFCIFGLVAVGCATSAPGPGVYHVVGRGENLFRIGKAYGVDYHELARRNSIDDPAKIAVGRRVFIPGATRRLPVEIIAPVSSTERALAPQEIRAAAAGFHWPMRGGLLTSGFGPRGETFHDGIDIAAPEGTPVFAARDGRVIYSDQIPGYGNIVIIEHSEGLTTVYAHNERNEVSKGDVVRQGDEVSRVGRTGRTTGPNLHFEVRLQNVARNPLYFLPPREGS
jgi:lipoprotein NlpD